MKIGIDIDDTLTDIKKDLNKAAYNYAKSIGKNVIEENEDADTEKLYKEMFSYEELKYYLKYIQEDITNNAIPRKNVVNIIKKLKKEGHTIVIITARVDEFHDDPYKQSKEWLDKHRICYDKLIVNARDKGIICADENVDLFIDDRIENCTRVMEFGIPVIRICDESDKTSNIVSFNNWDAINNYISESKLVKIVKYNEKLKEYVIKFVNDSMYNFIGRARKERPDVLNVENYYLNNNGNFWCAIDIKTNELVGTIALENRGEVGILKRFYVKENYHNCHIGKTLYKTLEEYLKNDTNIKCIYLACGKRLEKAHKFYLNNGFKKINKLDIEMHVSDDDYFFKKENIN